MSIDAVSFAFGAILVTIALLGGGISVKELEIPPIGRPVRVVVATVGLVFIATGIVLALRANIIGEVSGDVSAPSPAQQSQQTQPPQPPNRSSNGPPDAGLLAYIPTGIREHCEKYAGSQRGQDPPAGAAASAFCSLTGKADGVDRAWYTLFLDGKRMDEWFDSGQQGVAIRSESCNKPSDLNGETDWNDEKGNSIGRLRCYKKETSVFLEWTDPRANVHIVAENVRADRYPDLLRWWQAHP